MGTKHTPLPIAFRRPWPGTRRGLCLWVLALAVLFIGLFNYVLSAPSGPARDALVVALRLSHGSSSLWGWIMVGVAAVTLWSSYCHFGRDRYGYVLAATFNALWGLGYITGGLFFHAGARAFGGAVIWLVFAAVLATCAGFPNVRLGQHPPVLAEDAPTGGDQ